jgi:hypothetical protein
VRVVVVVVVEAAGVAGFDATFADHEEAEEAGVVIRTDGSQVSITCFDIATVRDLYSKEQSAIAES